MDIDQYKFNQSLLKIARTELKKRSDKIVDLELNLRSAKVGNNVLLFCVFILAIGMMFI